MYALKLVTTAALVLAAYAQTPTSSAAASISTCIVNCVSTAASSNGCSSISDLACICTNANFQQAALSCLQSSCSSQDVQTAVQLQQSECAAGGYSSAATTSTSPASSSAASAASSAVSSASGAGSSLSSAAASHASGASSSASHLSESLSSRLSSISASATGASGSSSAAGVGVALTGKGTWVGLGTAIVGAVVGALVVF